MVALEANFEGGNAEDVRTIGPDHLSFRARKDRSPRPLWFYFRLTNVKERRVKLELANASECLGGTARAWKVTRPVFSYDCARWERITEAEYIDEKGVFSFSQTFAEDTAWVAFCYPYIYSDLLRYLESVKDSPYARVDVIGSSAEGRKLYALTITDFGVGDSGKVGIAATARHHAGETPGSFSMEGMMDFLLSEDEVASEMRRKLAFRIYPMVDVDGVYKGAYGKHSRGRENDFNRDWTENPKRPEVKAVKEDLDRWARSCDYRAFFDFHAPTPGDENYFYVVSSSESGQKYHGKVLSFLWTLARVCADQYASDDYREVDRSDPEWEDWNRSSTYYQYDRYGVLSLCCEMSYNTNRFGRYMTQDAMRELGKGIALAMYEMACGEGL